MNIIGDYSLEQQILDLAAHIRATDFGSGIGGLHGALLSGGLLWGTTLGDYSLGPPILDLAAPHARRLEAI